MRFLVYANDCYALETGIQLFSKDALGFFSIPGVQLGFEGDFIGGIRRLALTLILRKIGRVLNGKCKIAGVLFCTCKMRGVLLPETAQTVKQVSGVWGCFG